MRVLGVDPGLSRCGIGVVETGTGGRLRAHRAGVIRTSAGDPVPRRLACLAEALNELLAEVRPDAVAVERVFFTSNVSTGIGVAQAAGVVLLLAEQDGQAVTEYTPTQVKATVTGSGAADKEQVAYMVRTLLGLSANPRPADAADALALAVCHLQLAGSALDAGGGPNPRLAAAASAAPPGAGVVRRGGRS